MITLIKILCFINTDVIASTLNTPPPPFFLNMHANPVVHGWDRGVTLIPATLWPTCPHILFSHTSCNVLSLTPPFFSVFLQRDEIQQWPFSLQHPFPFYWWPPGQTGVEGQRLSVWLFIDGKHSLMSADKKLGRRKKRRKSRLLARQRRRAAEKHFKTRGAWKD